MCARENIEMKDLKRFDSTREEKNANFLHIQASYLNFYSLIRYSYV